MKYVDAVRQANDLVDEMAKNVKARPVTWQERFEAVKELAAVLMREDNDRPDWSESKQIVPLTNGRMEAFTYRPMPTSTELADWMADFLPGAFEGTEQVVRLADYLLEKLQGK